MKRTLTLFTVVAVIVLSAVCSSAALVVDQENLEYDGVMDIPYFSPTGQSFTPSQSNLAAIAYMGGGSTYLIIREDTITGNILFTTNYETPGSDDWTFFDIAPDLWLKVGETYVFQIEGDGYIYQHGGGNHYPNGGYYFLGELFTGDDVVFRTYYDDAAAAAPAPIPGAIWLMGTGLAGLMGLRRRKLR